jgi:ribulose-phosphate 3-epimerase
MAWDSWIRGGAGGTEVLPSLYAGDFMRLGAQIEALLEAGCRVFHFDVGDGHFIPPVTIGPVVLRSIAPTIHAAGGILDCHLMVDNPGRHFEEIAESGGDTVSFHHEVVSGPDEIGELAAAARALGLSPGLAFNPSTEVAAAARDAIATGLDFVLCMSIVPGYSGQPFLPGSLERIAELRGLLPAGVPVEVDGGVGAANIADVRAAGAGLLVAGSAILSQPDPAAAYRALAASAEAAAPSATR